MSYAMILSLMLIGGSALAADPAPPPPGKKPAEPVKAGGPAKPAPAKPVEAKVPTEADPKAGHSYHGEAFDDGPRQRAHLMEGMGDIHFAVTTQSPEAQKFFTQGVGQLHGFWYWEAERSFRQAAMLDPDCAMAYWGMAMANVNNQKRAAGFAAQAEKRKAKASRREGMWIDSAGAYFRETKDLKAKATNFYKAMENIAVEFPESAVEAKAFLAWAMWTNAFSVPITSKLAVNSIIGDVLRDQPMHPGAHHYRIHLWDGDKPQQAVLSADLFGPSQPGIAHAWHMPGHIYTNLQRYADAAKAQEASARVDHKHMMTDGVMPYQIHNYAHNNQWMITSLSHVGRVHDAAAVARNLMEIPRHPKQNKIEDKGSCAYFGRARLVEVLSRYEMWSELAAAGDSILEPTDVRDQQILRLRAIGAAHFALGDLCRGCLCITELEEMLRADKTENRNARAAVNELNGRLAAAQGDPKGALAWYLKAGDMRKETISYAYLAAGDKEKAEKTIEQAAASADNQVSQWAAFAEILDAVGKPVAAADALKKVAANAAVADRDLPVLRRLEPIAARLHVTLFPKPAYKSELDKLGPLTWAPVAAPSWNLPDGDGKACSTNDFAGKPVLVLFHLGPSCPHCVEQLQKFGPMTDDFAKAGIRIVAVASDPGPKGKPTSSAAAAVQQKFPFPLLTDADRSAFKAWRVYDDFENLPLHGTFLIDAKGLIRWQDIGPDPFSDPAFLLKESRRLLALPPAFILATPYRTNEGRNSD